MYKETYWQECSHWTLLWLKKINVLTSLTFAECMIGAQANKTWLNCGAVLASTSQITESFKVVFCLRMVIDGPIFSF